MSIATHGCIVGVIALRVKQKSESSSDFLESPNVLGGSLDVETVPPIDGACNGARRDNSRGTNFSSFKLERRVGGAHCTKRFNLVRAVQTHAVIPWIEWGSCKKRVFFSFSLSHLCNGTANKDRPVVTSHYSKMTQVWGALQHARVAH